MLKIEKLNFKYDSKEIFKDFSLNIKSGDRIALKGVSGSGKSTLLRLIAGLEKFNSGKILFNNIDITNLSPYRRNFGYVFQDFALFPHLNVEDNVLFGISNLKKNEQKILLNKYTKMLQIESLLKYYPHELSGGQKQRVAIARTLITSPKVILLDEIFSALDSELKERVRLEILHILKTLKITTILVTHDSDDADILCDKTIEIF